MALALVAAATGCATNEAPAGPPLIFLGEAVIDPQPGSAEDPQIGGLSSLFRIKSWEEKQ